MSYNKFSDYLMKRYGVKVYKLPINIPVSCPNRDGRIGSEGCIFCGEEGAGFECLPDTLPVTEQMARNAASLAKRYKPEKYIAYFQNFSNTYLPLEPFKAYMKEACAENVAALYVSTRPDCVGEPYLDFLGMLKKDRNIDMVLELGLQTVNYRTLKLLNRGHTLAEFVDAVLRIKQHGLEVCAHYITDLPMDTPEDVMEGAKILSALRVNQVKCHALSILKGTALEERYEAAEFLPVSLEQFIERTILFLEHLSPEIVVQRLLGRTPEERTLFCNWGMSWWKIRDMIEERMNAQGRYQGRLCDYLNGTRCSMG